MRDVYKTSFLDGQQCKIETVTLRDEDVYIHIEVVDVDKEWHITFPEKALHVVTKQFNWNAKVFLNYSKNTGDKDGQFNLSLDDPAKNTRSIRYTASGNRVDLVFLIELSEGKKDLVLFETICSTYESQKQVAKRT